jgi:hypothetical protein
MSLPFDIFAPTYRRPGQIFTHKYFPDVLYAIEESEIDSYRKEGLPDKNIWPVPSKAQGNLCRVRNWILDHAPRKNLVIVDDDLNRLGIWWGNKHFDLSGDRALEMIESWFILADDLKIKFWGLNCLQDKGSYREYTPFSLGAYIGGPFQAFLNMDLRYDESLPLKEDYDLTLQVLNKYRRVLRINFAHYFSKQHTNKGGCAVYRTIEREREQLNRLRKKWGSDIVKIDSGNCRVTRNSEINYDINPIIKIPIRGI